MIQSILNSGYLRFALMALVLLGLAQGSTTKAASGVAATTKPLTGAAQGQTEQVTPTGPLAPAPHQIYLPLLAHRAAPSDPIAATGLSTPLLIEQAFARGEISADERTLYLAYALYEPQSLPAQFHSNVGWYGTQYVVEVQTYMQSLSAASTDQVQQELGRMNTLAAEVCDTEDGPDSMDSTNFHFNYDDTTIGAGLAIADYVTSMEATFVTEVTNYGWAEPPLCTVATCGIANPWGKYPVQIFALGTSLYGYVTSGSGGLYTGFIGDNPNTSAVETAALASCMVLNDNFDPLVFTEGAQSALDATTAHEFVHAIQNGYGDPIPHEDSMWRESSASYMEDEVFDSSNSAYSYLWPVVSNSLGEWPSGGPPGGISQYSNFLFFRHVAEHNGGTNVVGGGEDIMQRFFENVGAGQEALTAYNNALATEGTNSTNLADAFHRYAIAAKFSKACGGTYAAPYCFEEGAAYVTAAGAPSPVQGSIAATPGTFNGSIQNHYAANWVTLPTAGSPYQVTLNNTDEGGQLRGSLVCDTGSTLNITPFSAVVGAGASTTIASFNATDCTSVVAVITNQEQTSGNPSSDQVQSHTYTLAVSTAASSADIAVTKTDASDPVVQGNNITYKMVVSNNGPDTASSVTLVDTLPTGVSFVSATPGSCSHATGTVTCNLGNLTSGSSTNVTIVVSTSGSTPASVSNTASVSSTTSDSNNANNSDTETTTINPPTGSTASIIISSDENGKVPGLSYRDEDIMAYNPNTGLWSLIFDGSDVGLGNVDVDGFAFLPNDHLLLSVDKDFTLSGFGQVDESDILEFTPSSYGPTTNGSYAIYFDGSDVGLDKSDEDVDAIDFDASGKLLISVNGAFKAPGASGNVTGNDEDLFRLTGATGANTSGVWDLYFDGSDVGLTSSNEDIFGLWADHANSQLYLSTHGNFSVTGAKGDEDDIFICRYGSLGATTTCTFSLFWNGDSVGFDEDAIDGLSIGVPPTIVSAADSSGSVAMDDTVETAGDDANEANPLDGEEMEDEVQNLQIFLPLVKQ